MTMMSFQKTLSAMAILCCIQAVMCMPTLSQVHIGSVKTVDTRIPIAVPPLTSTDPSLLALGTELAEVIAYDLEFSGLFKILPASQYPQGFVTFSPEVAQLNLDPWKKTKAEHLVYGLVMMEPNAVVCQLRVFDLFSKKQIKGQELRVPKDHPRLNPHRFSEEIVGSLDGIPGIGTTEIVFSAGEIGRKEIYVADYDGSNIRKLTSHNSISIKPKVSPDGKKIAYLSYKDRYAFLYIYDRETGISTPLSKEVGLNSSPSWSPDGKTIAMTLSKDANTEIYLKNPDGTNPRRLTKNQYGDTSPCFSPDGKKIAFVSDRGGSAQIYVMNADGSGVSRLSMQGGSSYDPAWSPDGKSIAYVVEKRGEGLEIWVMNADGSNARRITNSPGTNESPTWSPDSRHIAFMSTRTGTAQLWTATIETGHEKRIQRINLRAEGPTWGPRRK